jgi:hypothetical protein
MGNNKDTTRTVELTIEDAKRRTPTPPSTTAQQRTNERSFETSAPRQEIILIGFLLQFTAQQAAFFWMYIL